MVDISAETVAAAHPGGAAAVLSVDDRGTAIAAMGEAFARFLPARDDVAGVVGMGGGGGTSIITAGMRRLPLGLPKVMVSTLASGDVAPYVDVSDIIMMPSVTDMAGLNRMSRVILKNAAEAITAMANRPADETAAKPALGLTMFGVTTPCVTAVVERLKADHDCLVFHATGTGGRAMEKLADSGLLSGVLDITTTEVCDLLFGGVLPATEDRFGAIARTELPYVGSVGALDMVNFWAPETVRSDIPPALVTATIQTSRIARLGGMRAIGDGLAQAETSAATSPVPDPGARRVALDIGGRPSLILRRDAGSSRIGKPPSIEMTGRRMKRLPLHIKRSAVRRGRSRPPTETLPTLKETPMPLIPQDHS